MDNDDAKSEKPLSLNKDGRSVLMRFWKYKFHYLIVMPGLLLILFFKIMPLIFLLDLSFVKYDIYKGVFRSPPAGMDNYKNLFLNPGFNNAIINTLTIKLEYIFVMAVLSVIIAWMVSQIRSGRLRFFFTTLFLIPYFIPAAVLSYIFYIILSQSASTLNSSISILREPSLSRIPIIAVEILRNCGIPIFIAISAAFCNKPSDSKPSGVSKLIIIIKSVTAFSLIQCSTVMSCNFDSIRFLQNSSNYKTCNVVDTLIYEMGASLNISFAAVACLIQFAVQTFLTLVVFFLFKGFLKESLFLPDQNPVILPSASRHSQPAGIIAAIVFSFIFIAPLSYLFKYSITTGNIFKAGMPEILTDVNIGAVFITYIAITAFAVIINAIITLTLAYPLTVRDLPGRNLYIIFLLLVMNIGGLTGLEYISIHLLLRNFGIVNTFIPYIVNGFFQVINIFVIKESFNVKFGQLKEELSGSGNGQVSIFFRLYIPKIRGTLLGLAVLQFAAMWNTYSVSLIYTVIGKIQSPVVYFGELIKFSATIPQAERYITTLGFGLLVSLPPIVLFILLRRLLSSDAFVSRAR